MAIGLIGSFPDAQVESPKGDPGGLAEHVGIDEHGNGDLAVSVRIDAATEQKSAEQGHQSPKPDTPFRFVGRLVIASTHAGVLCGIVGLLLWQVLPLFSHPKEGLAQIVAAPLYEIRSPVDGVFVALRHMANGTRVAKGQHLGWIQSPQLDADIQTGQRKLEALKRRELLLGQRGFEFQHPLSRPDSDREFRQCAGELVALESELDRLLAIKRQLRVVSPVDGQISNGGFSGSKAVETNDTVAYVWPDNGDLLVEVKAPRKDIHRLIQADRVEAQFSTPGGQVSVTARPIAGALRVFTLDRGVGKKKELWGVLQCLPVSIPQCVAYPGPLGTL